MSDERSKRIILERRARFVAATLAALSPAACKTTPARSPIVEPAVCLSAPMPTDPDSDGDGIPDRDDKCPYTFAQPAPIGREGCPQPCLTIIEDTEIRINVRVVYPENVATPPPAARPILDEVAKAMRDHRELILEIVGRASTKENEGVAYARANLVRSSLVARGIPESRLQMTAEIASPTEPDAEARVTSFRAVQDK